MTSPRQHTSRQTPPLTSREAALVGALTAFVKAPAYSRSPSQHTVAGHGRRGTATSQESSRDAGRIHANGRALSSSPKRSPYHDLLPSTKNLAKSPHENDVKSQPPQKSFLRHEQVEGGSGKAGNAYPIGSSSNDNVPSVADPVGQRSRGKHAEDATEETVPPSTSSLVQLFEAKGTASAAVRSDTPFKSPKPLRRSLVLSQDDRTISSHLAGVSSDMPRNSLPDVPMRHVSVKSQVSSADSFKSAEDMIPPFPPLEHSLGQTPSLPPRRPSLQTPSIDRRPSQPSPVQPITSPHSLPNYAGSPYSHGGAAASTASIQATYNALHPRRMPTLKTGDSLANAIVASSLASSRAPSPSKVGSQPPLLRARRSHHSIFTRTPSPNKHKPPSHPGGFSKHTLRKEKESSSDDDGVLDDDPYYKHKRKRHLRKHANKYHEGDRKRWRNAVTETERSRYEGVWAANKGILSGLSVRDSSAPRNAKAAASWQDDERALLYGEIDMTPPSAREDDAGDSDADDDPHGPDHSFDVHSYVVRDIWSRSRLPAHVLEEVWLLVALGGAEEPGWVSKEEFVVGMWLIDQRLKGRKLPLRVSDSVWDSVRLLKGIRIKSAKGKGRGW